MSLLLACDICKQTGFKSTGGLKNHQSRSKKCAMARQILSNSTLFDTTGAPHNLQLPHNPTVAAEFVQVDEVPRAVMPGVAE